MTHDELTSDELRIPYLARRYSIPEAVAARLVAAAAADPTTRHPTGRLLSDPSYGAQLLDKLARTLTGDELDELTGPEPHPLDEPDEHMAWRQLRYRLRRGRRTHPSPRRPRQR